MMTNLFYFANCSTCKLATLQRKVGRRLTSGSSFSYGTDRSISVSFYIFCCWPQGTSFHPAVCQSEVPALKTSLLFPSLHPLFPGMLTNILILALCAPEQIHLAHGGVGTLWVSWLETKRTNGGAVMINGTRIEATEGSYRYQAATAEAVYESPLIFHGEASVQCGQTYVYYVMSGGAQSQEYVTKTLTCPSKKSGSKTAIIGDWGQTTNASQTLDHLYAYMTSDKHTPPEQLWLLGDLSYADANKEGNCTKYPNECSQGRWDTWGNMVESVTAVLPTQVLAGNHEPESRPTPLLGEEYLAFKSRFKHPSGGSADGPYWYSWEAGNAHFITLNCYMPYSEGSDQYAWLENNLAKIDRSVISWVFVSTHAPWYNSNFAHQGEPEEEEMRLDMEGLLRKYEVDLLFCGHVHSYERTYGVFNGTRSDGDKLEINIGDGGNREVLPYDNWMTPQPDWSAFRQTVFGHGILETFNETHALWTWHTIKQPEDQFADCVWLIKNTALPNAVSTGVTAFPTKRETAL